MKKIVTIGIGCLLSLSLSGCSLGSVIDRFTASDDAAIQDIQSLSLLLLLSSEEALSELPHPTASPAVIVATDKIAINFFNFIIILSLDSHLFSFCFFSLSLSTIVILKDLC